MGAYQLVAVGTDGSESSFRAVDRAATVAADSSATLLIICAYHPAKNTGQAEQQLGEDAAFHVVGSTPAEETLRDAKERASAKGVGEVETIAVEGDPIEVVTNVVNDRKADLLVIVVRRRRHRIEHVEQLCIGGGHGLRRRSITAGLL